MFEKGHKNKRIHLLRLAVMAASLSFCLFGCSGLHAVKNRGRSAEMDTDSLVVYSLILWILLTRSYLNLSPRQEFLYRCVPGEPENF